MRLAVFTTHPIQYQVPWWRALAVVPDLQIHVFYSRIPDEVEQGEGFGQPFQWDVPLLEGYAYSVLASRRLPSWAPAFARQPATGIGAALRRFAPDAVLLTGWQELSLVQALVSARMRRIPILLRGESNAKRRRGRGKAAVHRLIVGQAEAVLAIGASNADFCRAAGARPGAIHMAPYFVDNARFSAEASVWRPRRAELRRRFGLAQDAIVFLFAGKLEPKKRVADVLDAVRQAQVGRAPVHALVVGSGEQMDAARTFVDEHSLPVVFAGFLNQSEMPRAYLASDALVLPSDHGETWGLVVNEAMATGLPAIVSDRVGCADDLVVRGVTGEVFPFGDSAALARVMLDWSADPERLATLGRAARETVEAGYTVERAVAQTRAALRQVLAS